MKRLALAALMCAVALSSRAANFTVTNLNDSGPGSLRDAVAQANANPGADVITFSVTGTIVLTSGQIVIGDPLTIDGPGSSALTINGNGTDRVFAITDIPEQACPSTTGPSDFLVSISRLTLANGRRTTSNSGGALVSTKSLTLQDVVVTGSAARFGGGFTFLTQYAGQALTMSNVQVTNNRAVPRPSINEATSGGGVAIFPLCGAPVVPLAATVNIQSSLISGNTVSASDTFQAYAAGLYVLAPAVGSSVQVLDSRIVGNSVVLPGVVGSFSYAAGGIGAYARSMLVRGSEISENSANFGAGMEFFNVDASTQGAGDRMTLTVANSTFSGNTAYMAGGGLQLVSNVAGVLDNDTLANNNSQPGRSGAIRLVSNAGQASPTLSLESTIAANSASGVDIGIGGAIPLPHTIQANRSLIGAQDGNATIVGTGNLIGVNPLVGPLAFNGGTTRTQALQSGSPAINTGSNPLGLATDQRGPGFPRTIDGATDIGAYESAAAPPPPPVTNQPIPTLSEYALMLLALLLAGMGSMAIRRRR